MSKKQIVNVAQFLNMGNLKLNSQAKKWTPTTTVIKIKAFIAVLLEIGITRRVNFFSYWKNSNWKIGIEELENTIVKRYNFLFYNFIFIHLVVVVLYFILYLFNCEKHH